MKKIKTISIPDRIENAKVLEFGINNNPNGFGIGYEDKIIKFLTIAQYNLENTFYIFALTKDMEVIGDLSFDSIEEAKFQCLQFYGQNNIEWQKKL